MIGTNDNGLCQEKDCAGTCQDSARSLKMRSLAMARVSEATICQWIVPRKDRAEALHNLQAIDYKREKDCADRAPLKGGRDSGTVPEISSPSRESRAEKEPSFSGTKRGRS